MAICMTKESRQELGIRNQESGIGVRIFCLRIFVPYLVQEGAVDGIARILEGTDGALAFASSRTEESGVGNELQTC